MAFVRGGDTVNVLFAWEKRDERGFKTVMRDIPRFVLDDMVYVWERIIEVLPEMIRENFEKPNISYGPYSEGYLEWKAHSAAFGRVLHVSDNVGDMPVIYGGASDYLKLTGALMEHASDPKKGAVKIEKTPKQLSYFMDPEWIPYARRWDRGKSEFFTLYDNQVRGVLKAAQQAILEKVRQVTDSAWPQ